MTAGDGPVTAGAGPVTAGAAGAAQAGAGEGGATNIAGGAGVLTHAGAGGTDSGSLFDPGVSVQFDPDAGGGGGGPPKGDGNTATSKFSGGTAVFTQTGTDVTVVLNISCSNGEHSLSIRDGYSCDSDTLEKGVWDGKRGLVGDKGTITCSNNKGTRTYTRKSDDPALSWSVGSQQADDLTPHVIVITSSADPNASHSSCGNFF